mgnify:CR=1 FL=1
MFKHLYDVKMTYLEHFYFSGYLSIILLVGSFKALIHSIYPDIYITSTSELSEELNELLHNKKNI